MDSSSAILETMEENETNNLTVDNETSSESSPTTTADTFTFPTSCHENEDTDMAITPFYEDKETTGSTSEVDNSSEILEDKMRNARTDLTAHASGCINQITECKNDEVDLSTTAIRQQTNEYVETGTSVEEQMEDVHFDVILPKHTKETYHNAEKEELELESCDFHSRIPPVTILESEVRSDDETYLTGICTNMSSHSGCDSNIAGDYIDADEHNGDEKNPPNDYHIQHTYSHDNFEDNQKPCLAQINSHTGGGIAENHVHPEIVPWTVVCDSTMEFEHVSMPQDLCQSRGGSNEGEILSPIENHSWHGEIEETMVKDIVDAAIKVAFDIIKESLGTVNKLESNKIGSSLRLARGDNIFEEQLHPFDDKLNLREETVTSEGEIFSVDSEKREKYDTLAAQNVTKLRESNEVNLPTRKKEEKLMEITLDATKNIIETSSSEGLAEISSSFDEIPNSSDKPKKESNLDYQVENDVFRIQKEVEDTLEIENISPKPNETNDTPEFEVNVKKNMINSTTINPQSRNFPDRIKYNPALTSRNTEATKWFGQPTAEDKIWMRPSGKVDENAEQERKRLIKAMTRRHNPHLVPKWKPPKEKDFLENLSVRQKQSLERYETRRKTKIGNSTENTPKTVRTSKTSSANEPTLPSSTQNQFQSRPRENIVIESNIHSRDAISVWEVRLREKQNKEKLEKKRLSVGRKKTQVNETNSEKNDQQNVTDSSTKSDCTMILPTSEYIERNTINIPNIRSRWHNIECESNKMKSSNEVHKKRTTSYTVDVSPSYRSSQYLMSPLAKPKAHKKEKNVIVGPIITPHKNESFIDREIREAAEREEKWKQEQWEKMSEASAVSSEDAFVDRSLHSPDLKVITTIYTSSFPTEDVICRDIIKDAYREENWKEEHNTIGKRKQEKTGHNHLQTNGIHKRRPAESKFFDTVDPVISATTHGAPEKSKKIPSEDELHKRPSAESKFFVTVDPVINSDATTHGAPEKSKKIPSEGELHKRPPAESIFFDTVDPVINSSATTYGALEKSKKIPSEDELDSGLIIQPSPMSSEKHITTQDSSPLHNTSIINQEDHLRRQRITSLTSVVAPKGWEPWKGRTVAPVSPVTPVHRKVAKPEAKKAASQPQSISEAVVDIKSSSTSSIITPVFDEPEEKVIDSQNLSASEDKVSMSEISQWNAEEVKSDIDKQIRIAEISKDIELIMEKISETENTNQSHPGQTREHTPKLKTSEKTKKKKSRPSFEVSSGKSRRQVIIEKEMKEETDREEEWRLKQLAQLKQGGPVSSGHIVHSTREIRTPPTSIPPPPVNTGTSGQQKRIVKSLFADH